MVNVSYKTLDKVAGPLIFVKGVDNAAYGEMVEIKLENGEKIKKEIETSFGDNFWQVPFTAKELLVLFMYSDNIYNADTMRHKIKEIDGVAFTEVFFPKKITMPTNWISNSIKNAARSEKLHVPIKQII